MIELLVALLATAGAQSADPLAPARAGKIQCIGPNTEKKTCIGTATYVVRPDGSYDVATTIMINPTPLITMETRSSGKVEGGAVCGVVRKADYEAASFTMDGKPADEAVANAIRGQLLAAVAAMDGKNGCSVEKADGTLEVTLDGAARPDLNQKGRWVSPGEGYKIGM